MKYLIDFHHGVTEAQIDAYLEQYGYTFLQEWDNFDTVVLVESDVEPVKTDIVEYVLNNEILEIKPHFEQEIQFNPYNYDTNVPHLESIEISTSDEKDWWKNYVQQEPDFENPTMTFSRKGQNVIVYILDSGFNKNSPEFDNTDVSYVYSVTDNDYSDQPGHGTAIASIISGATCGITSAKLRIVKIFRPDRGTLQSEFLSALDAIINDCPDNTFAIANCSWTIPKNVWIENKLREMIFKGIFVIAAAGNNGSSIEDVTPASMTEAVTVGSFNSDLLPSQFSNYTGGSLISYAENDVNHGELDGWAPGEKIWVNGVDNLFGYSAGTSMACAVTTAVLAYNLTDLLDSNGQRMSGYENIGIAENYFLIPLCFNRKNLLDFSDEKYANSKNFIATIRVFKNQMVLDDEAAFIIYAGKGKKPAGLLFSPNHTKNAKLLDELPANFWINVDGRLWGNPTVDQAVNTLTQEDFQKHIFRVQITNNDDEIQVRTITLYILSETFNKEDYPTDHEIVVTLQANCSIGGVNPSGCLFRGTAPDCSDDCIGVYGFSCYCCGVTYGPKNDGCYCGCGGL
jgi:hypothetical protein